MSMQCVILVGGLGTRLGTLTKECPKPMLPVAGRPFLDLLIENLVRFGFSDVLLLAGYRSEVVSAHFEAVQLRTQALGVTVTVIAEPGPLGTAGALLHAAPQLSSEFLLINGDSFFDFNLLDLAGFPGGSPLLARMALRRVKNAARYGVVTTDGRESVTAMRARPEAPAADAPGLINGGVYWLKREIVDLLPEGPCSIEHDIFPCLAIEMRLSGREYEGFFLDIGIPEDYRKAQQLLPLRRPALFLDRDGVLNRDDGYTHRIEDFHWNDGAVEAIRMANDANWFVFVVTNQAGVARGLYEEEDVWHLHGWMNTSLRQQGAHIDDFRFCPHHSDGIVPRYKRPCAWRKPNPGMIKDLAEHWPVDLESSLLVGDKSTDMDAGAAAGVRSLLYQGGNLRSAIQDQLPRYAPF